jgi:hypothetical protein
MGQVRAWGRAGGDSGQGKVGSEQGQGWYELRSMYLDMNMNMFCCTHPPTHPQVSEWDNEGVLFAVVCLV